MPPFKKEDIWDLGQDETVEVNQRALIDKILARYSGEYTIFRELLQNADDAGAEHVQVKFYSQAGLEDLESGISSSVLPDVKKDSIHRYVVTNDGIPFRTQDWHRLKKIAEGNPDEEKIGAFGVGFYSLWSVCDDPFVESGNKWMGFYWKDGKDQLLARSGDLPPDTSSPEPSSTGHPWTSFTMNLRSPTVLEGPLDFARFLITSLTFMKTIKKIDMQVDGIKVLEVIKGIDSREKVFKKGMKTVSTGGMMNVLGVDATTMVITAKVMKWLSASGFTPPPLPAPSATPIRQSKISLFTSSFFRGSPSPMPEPMVPARPKTPEDPLQVTILSREIQIYQADIKVTVSPAFGKELERATKKSPPQRMPANLVFSRGEEEEGEEDVGSIFGGLCPALDSDKSAKIFIGQATGQTTGIGGHLAARFIPTVERESIDLVDRHVSHWNRELLWVGGYLSRMIYELELQELSTQWKSTSVSDPSTRARILARGLRALRFFSYKPTTPSLVVGQEMELAFFNCVNDNTTFPIISTGGILPISSVHTPDESLQKFVPDLPVLTASTITNASRLLARLRERSLLKDVTFNDVIKQLNARPLSELEMIECLKWWQAMGASESHGPAIRTQLLNAAILINDSGKVVPLSVIRTYVKPQSSSIPTDMPLPLHTLPYAVTRDLKGATITSNFGWTELTIQQYIDFLINPPMSTGDADPDTDLTVSPVFAEKVLGMLGRAWQSISSTQQVAIAASLHGVPCIPTKAGMKVPGEAYFDKNLLFDDLPTLALPKNSAIKGGLEKMLLFIGVRKTVNLQLVFTKLIGGGEWTCQELMRYLVSVRDTLTPEEMRKLQHTAAFPLDVGGELEEKTGSKNMRKPFELFEPADALRELGLPMLRWGEGKWRHNSDEAKMLYTLGLRRFPPIDMLLGIASGSAPMNAKALSYLLNNMNNHYPNFDPAAFDQVAFLPAVLPNGAVILARPGSVFSNPACSVLGFAVAQPPINTLENAGKLRIATDPAMDRLVVAMMSSPPSETLKARAMFEYLASRLSQAPAGALDKLQNVSFIPVHTASDATSALRLAKPTEVYFASRDSYRDLYQSFFTFIDFGEKANLFLRYCGVRSEPSVKDIAGLLTREPGRMLSQAGSSKKYLEQLRLLATNWNNFDSSTKSAMKASAFLLASQIVPSVTTKSRSTGGKAGAEEDMETEWVLCKASDIAIVDDITPFQYFGKYVLAAPEEQLLEEFYANLGARSLASFVKTEVIPRGPSGAISNHAKALRSQVLQRLTIFLAEARRRQTEYTADWLGKEGNFSVAEVQELKARYTYNNGRTQHQHFETLYATSSKGTGRAITLTLSTTAQPDDFEIASSLVNILMKSPRPDDSLLFHSILSTPLLALKKRGFNVDRILNQERQERLRVQAEVVRDREKDPVKIVPAATGQLADVSDNKSIKSEKSGSTRSFMDKLKRKGEGLDAQGLLKGLTGSGSFGAGSPGRIPGGIHAPGGNGIGHGPGPSTARPTDLASIRSTVEKAIAASRPESSTQIVDSQRASNDVKESQNDYCDTTGVNAALDLASTLTGDVKLWIPKGFSSSDEASQFLSPKISVCQRFATEFVIPIGRVFNLSASVLNIFWDHTGPLIAFNKGGSLFCNARYYANWHDAQVLHGDRNGAFISWYFSLAHEIAHNLESAHNAAHEFYFSSIAEEYLVSFTRLLHTGQASLVDID